MSEHEQVTGMLSTKNLAPLELDPARTALIVVDMQRYFSEKLHQANLETLHVFGWVRSADDVIRMTQGAHAAV